MTTATRFAAPQKSIAIAIDTAMDVANQAAMTTLIAKTAAGDITLTAAQVINGLLNVSGSPGAFNMTLPTAALIVAAIPNVQIGSSFDFTICNNGDNTVTVLTGAGVTLTGTATVATAKGQTFKGIVTVATLASEAVLFIATLKAAQ